MSTNPFMDYQEQFFKLWNDNMDKMLESDAYKAMTKNIPGAEAYTKAMESMVPNVEKYWKNMAAAMPELPSNPVMDYWKDMADKMPGMDYFKNFADANAMMESWKKFTDVNAMMDAWKDMADKMPGMDYFKKFADANAMMEYWKNFTDANAMMDAWKKFTDVNAMMDSWKQFAESNPFMDYWKNMADNMPDMGQYWKSFQNMLPNMEGYWKNFTGMMPGMNAYWDNFAKMMPNPEMFSNMAPFFKVPGFEGFTKVFDMWKSFGDPSAMVEDFQKNYMDIIGNVMKSLFPETVQPFIMNPTDFMDMMVGYYKQFVSPWMEIDADIMARLAEGDPDAYIDFFKDYQVKYAENVEKYFTVLGMGLNREANEDYMKVMNQWNKAMISMGELMAVITKTGQESFNQIAEKVQADLAEGKTITTFRDFYNVWYSVTEAAYEKLLATDEFAKVFDDFSDRYAQYMIAQNKVYERMLSFLPIPTNTDMKSLYRTVYDLRKDVRDLKKALEAKETKKGDK